MSAANLKALSTSALRELLESNGMGKRRESGTLVGRCRDCELRQCKPEMVVIEVHITYEDLVIHRSGIENVKQKMWDAVARKANKLVQWEKVDRPDTQGVDFIGRICVMCIDGKKGIT